MNLRGRLKKLERNVFGGNDDAHVTLFYRDGHEITIPYSQLFGKWSDEIGGFTETEFEKDGSAGLIYGIHCDDRMLEFQVAVFAGAFLGAEYVD